MARLALAGPFLRQQRVTFGQTPLRRLGGKVPDPAPVLEGPNPNVEPTNLSEQLALEEAAANEGSTIMTNLVDAPRLEANYGDGEWVKVQWVHRSPSGSFIQPEPGDLITNPSGNNIVVHFFKNIYRGQT